MRLLTYEQIAEIFGIERESARQLVIRKRWPRTRGNDGKARIQVPPEAFDTARTTDATGDDPSDRTGDSPSNHTGDDPSDAPLVLAATNVLTRHIERLEGELAEAKAALAVVASERDADRLRAAQVEALRAVLEVERDAARSAVITVEAERDRWHAAATAPRGLAALVERFRRRAG